MVTTGNEQPESTKARASQAGSSFIPFPIWEGVINVIISSGVDDTSLLLRLSYCDLCICFLVVMW